jgi:hypothetical protein
VSTILIPLEAISGSSTCTEGTTFGFIARGGFYGDNAPGSGQVISLTRSALLYF